MTYYKTTRVQDDVEAERILELWTRCEHGRLESHGGELWGGNPDLGRTEYCKGGAWEGVVPVGEGTIIEINDETIEREAAFDWHAEYAEAIFDGEVPIWEQVDPDSIWGSIKERYIAGAACRLRAAAGEQT